MLLYRDMKYIYLIGFEMILKCFILNDFEMSFYDKIVFFCIGLTGFCVAFGLNCLRALMVRVLLAQLACLRLV